MHAHAHRSASKTRKIQHAPTHRPDLRAHARERGLIAGEAGAERATAASARCSFTKRERSASSSRSFSHRRPAFTAYIRLLKNKKLLGLGAKWERTRETRVLFFSTANIHGSVRRTLREDIDLTDNASRERWYIIDIYVNDLTRTQSYASTMER